MERQRMEGPRKIHLSTRLTEREATALFEFAQRRGCDKSTVVREAIQLAMAYDHVRRGEVRHEN